MPWHQPALTLEGVTVATPFRRGSAVSEHGAKTGWPKAGSQAWTIYLLLRERPRTMHDIEVLTSYPINIVCARIGWLKKQHLVRECGTVDGPFRTPNTLYRAL